MSTGAHSEEPNLPGRVPPRAKAFDLRLILGGLFLAYGLVVLVMGLVANDADLAKSAGTNINLWSGLVMMVLGGLFLVWRRLAPLRLDPRPQEAEAAGTAEAARTPEAARTAEDDADRGPASGETSH